MIMADDQLLLALNLKAEQDFSNFYSTRDLKLVQSTLKQLVEQNESDFVYLSGVKGAGKSHLLQAVTHFSYALNKTALYLPLAELINADAEDVLDGHERFQFLCIDDLDCLEHSPNGKRWQEALFHLYNLRQQADLPIYFAATEPASQLHLDLADLQSRLTACLSFQLTKLSDEEKAAMFQFRAEQLGMQISDQNALYLIQHFSRDSHDLMKALQLLDEQSLKKGRKITVPFIKAILGL
jgi:DnaA family protein